VLVRSAFVLGAAMLFSNCCAAQQPDDTPSHVRFTLAEDFVHAAGSTVLSGRYGDGLGVRAGWWLHSVDASPAPRLLLGADYAWTVSRWRPGLGAAWIDKTTSLNGTHWEIDTSLAYAITRRFFVEFRHYSHARKLGVRKDVPNGGWNLIGLGVAF